MGGLGLCGKCNEEASRTCCCTSCLGHRGRCDGEIVQYWPTIPLSAFDPQRSPSLGEGGKWVEEGGKPWCFPAMTLVAAASIGQTSAKATKDPFKPNGMRWKGKTWPYGTCLNCKGEDRLVIPGDASLRLVSGKRVMFFAGWCKACLNCVSEEAAKVVSDMAGAQFGGEKV